MYHNRQKEGQADIIIEDENENEIGCLTVYVSDMPTGITFDVPDDFLLDFFLHVGETDDVPPYTLYPEGANEDKLVWEVETVQAEAGKEPIVSVENGEITALNPGTAKINAYNTNNVLLGSIYINVPIELTGISLNYTELTMNKGDEVTLVATIFPEEAMWGYYPFDVWTDNLQVVYVEDIDADENTCTFTVRAISGGTTSFFIESDGIKAECRITVNPTYVESISMLSEMELKVGKSDFLVPTVMPSNADNKELTYSSSDESIATVDSAGCVTGVSKGTAVITATAADGSGAFAECTVTVLSKWVESIVMPTEISLKSNGSYMLIPEVFPSVAENKELTFTSSNESVAIVRSISKGEYCIVQAVGNGTAVIRATAMDGNGAFAECTVTVTTTYVESITMPAEIELEYGESVCLNPTIMPSDADIKASTYSSSNNSVATVNGWGKVTAVGGGTAVITATAMDGSGVFATCTVTVKTTYVESITMPAEIELKGGESISLNPTVNPSDADIKELTYSSSNESVATVDSTGCITAVGGGTAVITATATDGSGVFAECTVTVKTTYVESITMPAEIELKGGESVSLNPAIMPSDADIKGLTYSSSNNSVATVDSSGKVTAVGDGTAIITATSTDGSGVFAECTVTVRAYSEKCGENLTWTLDDNGTLTISGTGKMSDYSYDSTPWYASRASITSVVINNGVTSIGDNAFYECGLTSIKIPDSVTSIGDWAFSGCSGLTSVILPDSVTDFKEGAFYACSGLKSVTMPNGVTTIGNNMFSGCSNLTSITIPDSVTHIGGGAFGSCSSLTSIIIPDSVAYIGIATFDTCTGLTSVTIGNGVETIGNNAFSGCSSLTSITIPDSVTSIDDRAFYGCSSLASVTIGNGVKTIEFEAFHNCPNLTSVTIGNGVKTISLEAFCNCSNLTSITIPNSVTRIGDWAFYGCSSLASVTIGNGVETIGWNAFYNCPNLTSVIIPGSVTYIGDNAFDDTCDLTNVTIPDSFTAIEANAYSSNDKLTTVTIPDSITVIGSSAFSACSNLTAVAIPDSVTSIGDGAFCDCQSLTNVTIPDSVTDIEDNAFKGCTSLETVTIPTRVTSIKKNAFSSCRSLKAVTISDNVTSIGEATFQNCDSLTTVNFTGTEGQWNNISIGEDNEDLTNATINFEYEKPEKTIPASFKTVSCTYSGGKVTASVEFNNVDQGGTLYLAFYNDNRLVYAKEKAIEIGKTEHTFEITNADESYKNCKVKAFFWSGKNLIKPQAVFAETTVK